MGTTSDTFDLVPLVNQLIDTGGTWRKEQHAIAAKALRNKLVSRAANRYLSQAAAESLVDQAMPSVMRKIDDISALKDQWRRTRALAKEPLPQRSEAVGFRYPISDEMRRRILQQGIGAAVAAPVAAEMADEGR